MKLHDPVSALGHRLDGRRQLAGAEAELRSRLSLAPRAAQALPAAAAEIAQQHELDRAPGLPRAEQPRRKDARVVEHQAVARAKIRWQIIEMPVLNGARFGVQMQQARGVPALQRGLCDQLLRQIKRKIRSFQGVLPFFVIMCCVL